MHSYNTCSYMLYRVMHVACSNIQPHQMFKNRTCFRHHYVCSSEKKASAWFPRNSEAFASEFLDNLEEIDSGSWTNDCADILTKLNCHQHNSHIYDPVSLIVNMFRHNPAAPI